MGSNPCEQMWLLLTSAEVRRRCYELAALGETRLEEQNNMLLAFWLGGVVYGLYLGLFGFSLKVALKSSCWRQSSSTKIFFTSAAVMLVLITLYMGINTHRFLYAFSPRWLRASKGQLPIDYLDDYLTTWESLICTSLMGMLIWLGEATIIYRCFILWRRDYRVIILPVLLLAIPMGITCVLLFWFRHPTSFSATVAIRLLHSLYPLNIAESIIATGLTGYKVWRQYLLRKSAGLYVDGATGVAVLTAVKIIIESATLFTVQQAILCTLSFLDRPAQYLFQGMLVPCIGVLFALFTIRMYASENVFSHGLSSSSTSENFVLTPISTPATELESFEIPESDSGKGTIEVGQSGSTSDIELREMGKGADVQYVNRNAFGNRHDPEKVTG